MVTTFLLMQEKRKEKLTNQRWESSKLTLVELGLQIEDDSYSENCTGLTLENLSCAAVVL